MNQVEISPGSGIGSISIGMPRAEIHKTAGQPSSSFLKTPLSTRPTDEHADIGVHVYYDDADVVEFIEAFSSVEVRHSLYGLNPFETIAVEVVASLQRKGQIHKSEKGCVYVSVQLGVSLWRAAEEDSYFQAIGVAHPGYFD